MHPAAMKWLVSHSHADPVPALEIGARDLNGNARGLWPAARWMTTDLQAGPGVDLVADASSPDFPDLVLAHERARECGLAPSECFGLVLCTEVLEHVARPGDLLENIAELLRPRGMMLLTCATWPREPHSGVDGGPLRPGEHYQDISPAWLAEHVHWAGQWIMERNYDDLYLRLLK